MSPLIRPCEYCLGPTSLGICRHCRHIQAMPVTDEHALPPGQWVRRGSRLVFVPEPTHLALVASGRAKPFAPGLTCWQCLGDLYPGPARRTERGWRHADATECVRALSAWREPQDAMREESAA